MRVAGVGFLGAGYVGPVPMPVILMLTLDVIAALFLANTVLGRQIYAVGSNARAARLCGLSVERVLIFTYFVGGALTALAGVVGTGLLSPGPSKLGSGIELGVTSAGP